MRQRPPIAPDQPNKRALVLPGGGMRVAYQAGVVQALHVAGMRFSYADGTSGGMMNLAALLSGVEPKDLALRWRTLRPTAFIAPLSLPTYLQFPNLPALAGLDGIADVVLPHLGVDIGKLHAADGVTAQFNVCDFAAKSVAAVPHTAIELPVLMAGLSLPLLTPAVEHQGRTWTDAVWIRDSNLLAPVRQGANEIWVVWCIGNTPRFRAGFLNQYVHMIEMSAVASFNAELAEIARLNERIGAGERPFGHSEPIVVHLVKPALPIPLDPDYLAGHVSADALVDQGHQDAAQYLAHAPRTGIPLDGTTTATPEPGRGVSFRETMTGRISFFATDPVTGGSDANAVPIQLHATIDIRDVDGFVTDPAHRGSMAAHLVSPRLGGTLPATATNFQLFAPTAQNRRTEMIYECGIRWQGQPHWFSGRKHIDRGTPFSLWGDTTTLHVLLHEGHDAKGKVVAAGILRLGVLDFIGLLTTLWARDCMSLRERLRAKLRFAGFFMRELWATYGLGVRR